MVQKGSCSSISASMRGKALHNLTQPISAPISIQHVSYSASDCSMALTNRPHNC
jgi:hypothetical protein